MTVDLSINEVMATYFSSMEKTLVAMQEALAAILAELQAQAKKK